jgi:hypothetical protein
MVLMSQYPSTPFPPKQLLVSDNNLILIGIEGEIAKLDPNTLELIGDVARPYPTTIEHATIADGKLIASWVEHELLFAKIAALPIDEPFKDGAEKSDLRTIQNTDGIMPEIAGSVWCHVADGEPLGICSNEELICFSNYMRGVYCIDSESNEKWRRPEIKWPNEKLVPGGSVIHSIQTGQHPENNEMKCIWIWSIAGGWAALNWSDGEIIAQGMIEHQGVLDIVRPGINGQWLIGLLGGNIVLWSGPNNNEKVISGGPVCDSINDLEGWKILGWRKDITIKEENTSEIQRRELASTFYEHPIDGLLVLNNIGEWGQFHSK